MSKYHYFSGNKRVTGSLCWTGTIFISAVLFLWRFLYPSQFAGTWDQVDFALALGRFDLLAMQPHFPGYPYFIVGGMVVNKWVTNPVSALSLFNSLLMLLSSVPIYWLMKRYISQPHTLLFLVYYHSLTFVAVMSVLPMSEGAAISIMWWLFWSLIVASESPSLWKKLLPLFFYSLLLGIRLSYLPFGIGIVYLWWQQRRTGYHRLLFQIVVAILFQLIWVMGLVATEGSISGFLKLALSFTTGHFTDWGGAISATTYTLLERFDLFVIKNLLWTGLFSQSYLIASMYGLIVIICSYRLNVSIPPQLKGLLILGLCYFLWVFFAQNPEKPRHMLPVIILASTFFYYLIIQSKQHKRLIYPLLFGLITVQAIFSYQLIKEQAVAKPATYQLVNDLSTKSGSFVVYTWEEERVMDYLRATFDYKKVLTYDYFLSDIAQRNAKTIYITDRVLTGFADQGVDTRQHVRKVAEYKSNPFFDPVYYQITLYEWRSLDR